MYDWEMVMTFQVVVINRSTMPIKSTINTATQINNTESIYLSATFHQSGGSEIDFS